jgi:hypothetical protein
LVVAGIVSVHPRDHWLVCGGSLGELTISCNPTPWVPWMDKLLIVVALACQPGDRLIDLSGKIPRGLQLMDLVVSVELFYARLYIYQLGYPDSFQQCCSGKPTSVLRVPVGAGRFCVRQSQPQMKWSVRALGRPDVET